jgi:hypothetical protein
VVHRDGSVLQARCAVQLAVVRVQLTVRATHQLLVPPAAALADALRHPAAQVALPPLAAVLHEARVCGARTVTSNLTHTGNVLSKSAVAGHCVDRDTALFHDTSILATKTRYVGRIVRETIEMELHPNSQSQSYITTDGESASCNVTLTLETIKMELPPNSQSQSQSHITTEGQS